ncbi:hypothetical protein ISN45_Aa07g040240 [Arabidopsis thaliana x Arabidopsis arenosa]|uniref:Uncharacterized protein n=1 Tax=Arabidopsis thaliana x Arabidopsis arenosa TaxID=1240361 RepID=A0A8T1YDW7_9BRAS|nr:hypothetical protein ISN45_Aa07g040240 [Arabidopsis thaliana x Arabidopsis arenosa]
MPLPTPPPTELYIAVLLPNPISLLINYIPVSQTPLDTLRNLVNAVDINSISLDDFMTWPHFILPDSPFRPYFDLLLQRGSLCAQYLEGLRLSTNFITVAHGITMLRSVFPTDPYACFAHGLFLTTTGNYTEFMAVNSMFWEMVQNFDTATAVGELVMYHISQLRVQGPPQWQSAWRFVNNLGCIGRCSYEHCCRNCFFYWYARELCIFY